MGTIYFLSSIALGFVTAKIFSGKKAGEQGRMKSLRFAVGGYWAHIHHWLWASIIVLILIAMDFYNPFVLGWLVGLILQGLTYNDFYKIIYKK